MAWQRLGWIDATHLPVGLTHLALPLIAPNVERAGYRFFATARDSQNRSVPVTAIADMQDEQLFTLDGPWHRIAGPGPAGHFDDSGLTLSDVKSTGVGYECATFGWRLRSGGGWFNEIGSMQLDGHARLLSRSVAPTLARTCLDPISMAYPTLFGETNVFYCAPSRLDPITGKPADFRILRLNLVDGLREVVVEAPMLKMPNVFAVTRPWVADLDGSRYLWFCARGTKYRLFRVPLSGSLGIDNSEFQIEMPALLDDREAGSVCYPSLTFVNGELTMLYNGSGYGLTGFGLAVWRPRKGAK